MNKKASIPMPQIGDIIYPIHNAEIIAWWEKPVKPHGKFVRIVWDASNKVHTAVCKQDYTTGIIAFLIGKPPGFGDVLKVVSVGSNTCRVIAINRYHDIIIETLDDETEDPIEDILLNNIYDSLNEDINDTLALYMISIASWGLLNYKKHGIPSYKSKEENVED